MGSDVRCESAICPDRCVCCVCVFVCVFVGVCSFFLSVRLMFHLCVSHTDKPVYCRHGDGVP